MIASIGGALACSEFGTEELGMDLKGQTQGPSPVKSGLRMTGLGHRERP